MEKAQSAKQQSVRAEEKTFHCTKKQRALQGFSIGRYATTIPWGKIH